LLVSRRSGDVRAVRSAGGAAKQVTGRDEQRRAARRASWARGARGYERAAGRARARGSSGTSAHSQETGEKEGERRKEEKRRKEKEKEKEEGRKEKKGRKRKEERGGIRGGRSRVGDRQPSGAGWDGGEEKEEGFGRCFEVG